MSEYEPGTVAVRVRTESEVRAVPFTRWPVDSLERLVKQFDFWGVVDGTGEAFGQWVIDSDAYFEIVIPDS